jgi:hypothetical protein
LIGWKAISRPSATLSDGGPFVQSITKSEKAMYMAANVSAGLAIVGGIMPIVGWGFYRRPDVPFWTYAPVWRANDYLYPTGSFLWKAGITIAAISGMLFFLLAWSVFANSHPDFN